MRYDTIRCGTELHFACTTWPLQSRTSTWLTHHSEFEFDNYFTVLHYIAELILSCRTGQSGAAQRSIDIISSQRDVPIVLRYLCSSRTNCCATVVLSEYNIWYSMRWAWAWDEMRIQPWDEMRCDAMRWARLDLTCADEFSYKMRWDKTAAQGKGREGAQE